MTTQSELVPSWVYNLADYCQMFDLSEDDLKLSLLDFPAGISSFNAQMHEKGYRVCSGDPLYRLSSREMSALSQRILEANRAFLKLHQDILRGEQTIESILSDWQGSLALFLDDYEQGKDQERYQFMKLPRFPFNQHVFDIGLCSDHLFHTHATTMENQESIIEELCRVAKEVRVFPLLNEKGEMAESLGQVMLAFQQKGYGVEVRQVSYHQMKGGNAMLRIWSTKCTI